MLSLWKLRVGAEDYYLGQVAKGLDDYYAGHGEMPGDWIGTGTSALGLAGHVAAEDLRAVLAGLHPGTGMTPNGMELRSWKGRIPGFDLTFSAPKSVSVIYALADPVVRGQVVEATNHAVAEALAWLEREACFVRRGSNNRARAGAETEGFGTRRVHGAGFVGAAFRHRSSRAGDPQLHTHVLVANLSRGPDGRWTALDGHGLYRSKRTAGVVYQTVLRAELARRLGIRWGPTNNDVAEIAGIPRRVLHQFSKRRAEIDAELERVGGEGPAAAARATLATRQAKTYIDGETLDQRWLDEAAEVGYTPADVNQLIILGDLADTDRAISTAVDGTGTLIEHVHAVDGFAAAIADELINHGATFTRHQVEAVVASALRDGANADSIRRVTAAVLTQPHLVPMPSVPAATTTRTGAAAAGEPVTGWEERWTSRRLLQLETELLALLTSTDHTCGVVDESLVDALLTSDLGATLGPDQADTVRRVTRQGRPVEVVVGRAGTGKTYTMNAVRTVFTAAGYTVIGASPTARGARELSDEAGINGHTFPRFMRHTAPHLTDRHVVIVDEAAMAGTIDVHQLLTTAHTAGSKVILVGDHHQLPEVGAGGGFAAAVTAGHDQVAELVVNRRQRHEWERDALAELRHGHVPSAFQTYCDHGRVTLADTTDDVHAAALADWWDSQRTGRHAVLLAGTRAEARALNRDARRRLNGAGVLHGPTLEVHGHVMQAGDRILLLRNAGGHYDVDSAEYCRVDNGMIGTITTIDETAETLTLALRNGRRIRLHPDYIRDGYLDYGYAATIHKAQGITCDDVFVVGPAGLYRGTCQ